MFQWDFDKPSTPVNFDTTISQDIADFNNFFSQNVASQTNTQAPAMPPMNFSGSALSNFQEQEEQPIIDYMTYDAPQPTEIPDLGNTEQQQITNQEYTGLLDAQEGLNPYGQNQNQT